MSRIAYLVSEYAGPSHTFVRREVAALRALGVPILPFSIRPSDPASDEAESVLGRPVWDYVAALIWAMATRPLRLFSTWRLARRHRVPGLRGLFWSQFHFGEAVWLARRLQQQGVTQLHNHFANSGATVGMLAAHCEGIRWSLTLHGISETDHPVGMLLPEKLERAEFVACASHFMRAQAMRMVGPDHWPKMHVVRCGIDLEALPATQAKTRRDVPQLVAVGRLSPEKGYFGLLDVLARLQADGVAFRLTIVGDGPMSGAIRARTTGLALDGRVDFAGALPEAATLACIAASDVIVLPSLMEGLPVVLIEALALRTPALASRVAGIPELIEDGKSGLLFSPSDWDDLERKLRQMLSCSADWLQMGEAGRAAVETEFRADQAALRLQSLFSKGRPSKIVDRTE